MPRPHVEIKPAKDAAGAVFLSPRIVDKSAFDEFGAALRTLIESATDQGRTLQAAATRADAAHQRLADSGLEPRLTAATTALAALDLRAAESSTLLAKATDAALDAAAIETRLARAAQEQLTALETRLTAAETEARARIDSLVVRTESRLSAALARAKKETTDLEGRITDLGTRLAALATADLPAIAALCDRAAALAGRTPDGSHAPGGLSDLIARAEHAGAVAAHAAKDLLTLKDQAEVLRRVLADTFRAAAGATADPRPPT